MAIRLNQHQNLNVSNQSLNLDLNNISQISTNSTSQAESIKLASKLRKIKENLDNCYLGSNKSLNSTICSTTNNNNLNDSFHTNTTANQINSAKQSPSAHNTVFRTSFSNSTIDHSSKYLLLNHQSNFEFELNNNNTSLEHILDQYSAQSQSPVNLDKNILKQKAKFLNNHVIPIYNDADRSLTGDPMQLNGLGLKQAVYTENVSRQSSIRSLISDKNLKSKPPANTTTFAKVKQIKARSQNNLENNEFHIYEKVEADLLKDWDKFKSKPFNNKVEPRAVPQPPRPQTRMGFQNNDYSNNEYSDNVTVASTSSSSSSSSSNRKFQDYSEECESILMTPKIGKDRFKFNSPGNSNQQQKQQQIHQFKSPKFDNETESVISDFVTNLKFDENRSVTSIQNLKFNREFQHDFDVNTTSDIYSDDNSICINNNNNRIRTLSSNVPSFVIREKKVALTKKLNSSINMDTNRSNQSGVNLSLIDDMSFNNTSNLNSKSTIPKEDERDKNYQRLSSSINDLFANLINHLEKQKNKEFIVENDLHQHHEYKFPLNTSNISNSNLLFNTKSVNQTPETNGLNNRFSPSLSNQNINNSNKLMQNFSKNSIKDKDSGFNQETSFYDSNSQFIPKPSVSGSHNNNNNQYNSNLQNINSALKELNLVDHTNSRLQSLDTQNPTYNTDTHDLSLLERYLYNEQVIAQKHAKIENLIQGFLSEKNLVIDDYSLIEYILNQEGISLKTFKQLIREKYSNIKWPDELLSILHQVINENPSSPVMTSEYHNESSYDNEYEPRRNESDIENKLNYSHQMKQGMLRHDMAEFSHSPSSSSRSYRRIKEIKNSTNTKKKHLSQVIDNSDILSDNFEEDEEKLKKTLSNSFVKRRERKGSLPEIVTSQIIDGENLTNEFHVSSYFSMTSNKTLTLNGQNRNEQNGFDTAKNVRLANDPNRNSRKGAFVLEVLRTSMFRSKSLTDLNSSLSKIENNALSFNNPNLINQHTNTFSSYKATAKSINFNLHQAHLNEARNEYIDNTLCLSLPKFNLPTLTENYIGLIWQCADMCYAEYRNKYKELRWLLNGDNKSAISKLKEIDQRLKIELNLKEKNVNLLEDLNRTTNMNNESSANKSLRSRLLNQLKLINEKIKELEMMRLFLRICEINSHGLDPEDMDKFFKKSSEQSSYNDLNHNQLQAKAFYDIIKMLYGNDAISTGFVYQFFVVYRYMCSSMQLFDFFKETFKRALNSPELPKEKLFLVLERTVDLIAMWLDGFYTIDFQQNQELITEIEIFIENEIKSYDESKFKIIQNLLLTPNMEFNLFAKKSNYFKKLNGKTKKINQEPKKINRIFNGAAIKKRILNSSGGSSKRARSNSKSKSTERNTTLNQDDFNSTICSTIRNDFFISDFADDLIASQLTLIEWDNFLDIHVCHCLNSKAQGVNCDSKQPIDPNNINSQACLFVDNYLSKSVYKMIQFNYLLTHWVAGEILMSDSVKNQANLIMKFLKIAKKCYDWTNFSSAFSIYEALQDITIRNLPAWQHVSSKSIHILEKIASFKVLFQNDPFAINSLTKSTNLPVIPSMHLFLLTVQQNEHGSFQLANGLWKWTKLGFLANLVDQIRNIQQHFACNFEPCEDFVEDLLQRIYYIKDFDLNNLAESSFLDYQSQKLNSSMSTIKNLIPINKHKK